MHFLSPCGVMTFPKLAWFDWSILTAGIGLHHAGLHENDRKVVEQLFLNQRIQVCVFAQPIKSILEHLLSVTRTGACCDVDACLGSEPTRTSCGGQGHRVLRRSDVMNCVMHNVM